MGRYCERVLFAVGSTILVSLLSGCGGTPPDQPATAPVMGIVKLDGKPLPNVIVVFNSDTGRPSSATTDENGKYDLNYFGSTRGATLGPHTVTITTPTDGPTAPNYRDPIPAKYNTATTLTANVKASENTFDFDLSSK